MRIRLLSLLQSMLLACAADAAFAQNRFDPDRSHLDQLVELAEANDVPESEISAALFDGRVVPDLEDLQIAYSELDTRTCAEVDQVMNPEAFAGRPCWFKKLRSGYADASWNDRFGPVPEERLFWFARRMGGDDPETGIPYTWRKPNLTEEQIKSSPDYDRFLESVERNRPVAAPRYFDWMDANDKRSDFASIYRQNRNRFIFSGKKPEPRPLSESEIADGIARAIDHVYEPDEGAMRDAYNRASAGNGRIIQVTSVEKRSCTTISFEDRQVLCELRPNARIAAQSNPLLDGLMKMAENAPRPFVFVVFERDRDNVWNYVRGYDRCAKTAQGFDCVSYK